MDLDTTFPLKLLLNLGRREDRRIEVEEQLNRAGMSVERLAAVDARWVRNSRGYDSPGRYALALTQRLALRRARQQGAEAVLLLEDDVIFHPEISLALERLDLPDDWGIFYLGGSHTSRPTPAGPGLVRCGFTLDTHAFAVRRPYYNHLIRALAGVTQRNLTESRPASDWILAFEQAHIPAYAAFPNLAWQAPSVSDLLGRFYSNYSFGGDQRHSNHVLRGLAAECLGGTACPAPPEEEDEPPLPAFQKTPAHPAFLLLTQGDWHQAQLWHEYLPADPDHYGLYCHPKHPDRVQDPLLQAAIISHREPTAWGHISLVRATLALLRAALENPRHTHFALLSESCIPIKPFTHLKRLLEIDRRSIGWFSLYDEMRLREPNKAARFRQATHIPAACAISQSQWMILTREAAELVVEEDFTAEFEDMFAPDECYFMTVLAMKGYFAGDQVRCFDAVWNRWTTGSSHPDCFEDVSPELAATLFQSPSPFARKFTAASSIREYGLHRID